MIVNPYRNASAEASGPLHMPSGYTIMVLIVTAN
jgi:hypothetical protein